MTKLLDGGQPSAIKNVAAARHNINLTLGKRAAEAFLDEIGHGTHQPGDLAKAIKGLRGVSRHAFLLRIEAALGDAR